MSRISRQPNPLKIDQASYIIEFARAGALNFLSARNISMNNGALNWEAGDGKKVKIKKMQKTTAKKFLDGEKDENFEYRLCAFQRKSRQLVREIERNERFSKKGGAQ